VTTRAIAANTGIVDSVIRPVMHRLVEAQALTAVPQDWRAPKHPVLHSRKSLDLGSTADPVLGTVRPATGRGHRAPASRTITQAKITLTAARTARQQTKHLEGVGRHGR
jgi:hypothetical protein